MQVCTGCSISLPPTDCSSVSKPEDFFHCRRDKQGVRIFIIFQFIITKAEVVIDEHTTPPISPKPRMSVLLSTLDCILSPALFLSICEPFSLNRKCDHKRLKLNYAYIIVYNVLKYKSKLQNLLYQRMSTDRLFPATEGAVYPKHKDLSDPYVQLLLERFDSYAEYSVSGGGFHIYGKYDISRIPTFIDDKVALRLNKPYLSVM